MRITSRWPINSEAKRAMPRRSVAERRRLSVVPQFSTTVDTYLNNVNCYRADDTTDVAIGLGLVPCFTPVRSPQFVRCSGPRTCGRTQFKRE